MQFNYLNATMSNYMCNLCNVLFGQNQGLLMADQSHKVCYNFDYMKNETLIKDEVIL